MDTTLSAPIGQLLDGRYLVESQLAHGGMATVYLGRDVRLDRTVALKIAHPELARDPEFASRFIGEARAVARLSSPNVVAIFDQGSTGDINYIAMEYVPGPTLREQLTARGRLSPREALDIIEGVLSGLAAAHTAGIIHRDVKPENVLLGTGSLVKVADFGLARAAAGMRNTKTGLLIGTAAYLAPEQVSSNNSDQRSDVYAAGVMLFEMLTGSQPHTGDTPLAVAYKHVNAVVPAPSSLVPDLPSALDALVALATSRDPELRPPDAAHYLQAIEQVRRGMPVPAVRRGAHAAPEAGQAEFNGHGNGNGNGGTFSQASTGRIRGPGPDGHAPGLGDYPPTAGIGSAGQPNHTMIVSDGGAEPEYARGGGAYGGGRRSRGYREPFLQRWLFSRRIVIVLAVVVVAAATWWLTAGQFFNEPRVTGLTISAARSELTNAGLVVVIGRSEHSDTVLAGQVIATDPAGGTRVRHGERVTLIRSLGPILEMVPNVTGQTVAAADSALQAAGLKFSKPIPQASTVQAGIVISTNPVAYTQWPKDKPVQVVVSAGPPLPNFVGAQLSAAQAAAQAGGYQIVQDTVPGSKQPPNTILKQVPAAGTPISPGEIVTVYVSPGPPEVAVPNVDGLSAHQAEQELTAAGFQVTENGGGLGGGGGGTVTSYSPTGQAPQGSMITITVNFGF
jgi:eukaryotic-like serine/threonine-protein kinase